MLENDKKELENEKNKYSEETKKIKEESATSLLSIFLQILGLFIWTALLFGLINDYRKDKLGLLNDKYRHDIDREVFFISISAFTLGKVFLY